MTSCGACASKIQNLNFMECSNTKCALLFCLLCINITQEEFNQFTDSYKADWLCPQCIPKIRKGDHTPVRSAAVSQLNDTFTKNINVTRGSRLQPKPSDQPSDSLDQNDVVKAGSSHQIALLVEEIRQLRHEVKDLKIQNSDINLLRQELQQIQLDLTANTATTVSCSENIKKSLEAKDLEIFQLKETITHMQNTMNIQEQIGLKNDIEICGVPEINNENLTHIALAVSQKLSVELSESDIDDITRTGPRINGKSENNKTSRIIVLKLSRKAKKDELLRAAKTRKNLTSEGIVSAPQAKLFINERLTKKNRLLFRDTRIRAQQYGFRFCWVRNGAILIRKTESTQNSKSPAILIQSSADLDKHMGPAREPATPHRSSS
ncbi:hypothetical protein O0L34_g2977 [Tuta absoluta]|nr:hypothetical protein O0L34_g2977 [Tuta absoluta]